MKYLILLIFLAYSCSHINTLNLKKHSFGKKPKRIIWFQIAGFTEEHIAMLRFGMSQESKRTSFEQMTCSGKMWAYNLFSLRPGPMESFRAQMLGTGNIKNNCEDLKKTSIWNYLDRLGYRTGILENYFKGAESDVEQYLSCLDEKKRSKESLIIWRMSRSPKGPFFHFKESKHYALGKIYYDKSCQKEGCHTSLFSNIKKIENELTSKYSKTLFIIRDHSFYQAMKRGDILRANEVLLELEKVIGYIMDKYKNEDEHLTLVTSSSARNIEFPKKGEDWSNFVRQGRGISFRNTSLISTVLAQGASAENFCGIFRESEVLPRLFWMTKTSILKQMFTDLL